MGDYEETGAGHCNEGLHFFFSVYARKCRGCLMNLQRPLKSSMHKSDMKKVWMNLYLKHSCGNMTCLRSASNSPDSPGPLPHYRSSVSSTSNTRYALPGMTPGMPFAPYAIFGGKTIVRFSCSFMSCTITSKPGIICPAPVVKRSGERPCEESNTCPFKREPV